MPQPDVRAAFFRTLQFAGDQAESIAEISANEAERGDRRDRDQCGNQRILDRRNAGLVPDQLHEGAQLDSPRLEKRSRADCDAIFN
jgi:hypothetical protein